MGRRSPFDMQALVKFLVCASIFVMMPSPVLSRARAEMCTLGGQRYNIGETWHPKLIPYGENSCVNCTCMKDGESKCVGVDCPKPDCDEPKIIKGQCCPSCEVGEDESGGGDMSLPKCEFQGAHYESGDVFPSNKTALKPEKDDQCVLCACYKGEVICHLKTCLQYKRCNNPYWVEDDCCLQCDDDDEDDVDVFLSGATNVTLEEGDCLTATGRQRNGSTWKPVVGQYGEMECIVCSCLNSNVSCSRLQCPAESSLKCEHPEHKQGGCCKQCPDDNKKKRRKKKKGKGRKRRCNKIADPKEKRKCKRRNRSRKKRNRNKSKNGGGDVIFKDTMKMDEVVHRLCIPAKAERLVYHTKGEEFESLAFDALKENTIEHMHWSIKKGKIQSSEGKLILEPELFRKSVTVGDLLGAVRKKDIKRFMKRLDKRQQRCKKKCRRKLLDRIIRKLKVKEVDLTKSC